VLHEKGEICQLTMTCNFSKRFCSVEIV